MFYSLQLQNFVVLQQKYLTSSCYRYADEVWSVQSILLVHQKPGTEETSGRFLFDWEASESAFAQFMMGITSGSPVKVPGLTIMTVSSPWETCDRAQEKLIFTDDDTVTQSKAVNFTGRQQCGYGAKIALHDYYISLPTRSCSHAEHSSSMTVFI